MGQQIYAIRNSQKQNDQNKEMQSENAMLKQKLNEMKESETESNTAQQIERAGGLQIDSSFLTVKECLSEYQSLRDQQYHKLHCEWKKCLKSTKGKIWHKLYINQICHSLMFDLLHLCYKYVRKYVDCIY